jgi:HEAT repeat protein
MDKTVESILDDITCGDDGIAETCVVSLGSLFEDNLGELLDALSELVNSPNTDTRWWSVRALAALSLPQVPSFLIQALGDKDPAVRQCAALGLSKHPDPQAIPALTSALSDPDQLTANLAGFSLAQMGKTAVPALLEVMDNGSTSARLRATRALATIGDTQAVPVLIAALDDDSAPMRHWANIGLERMGVGIVLFYPQ